MNKSNSRLESYPEIYLASFTRNGSYRNELEVLRNTVSYLKKALEAHLVAIKRKESGRILAKTSQEINNVINETKAC